MTTKFSRSMIPAGIILVLTGVFAMPASAADLRLLRLSLHQFEDGPVMPSSYEYLPGEHAWFSFRIEGFDSEVVRVPDEEEKRRVSLEWRVEVFDGQGLPLEEPQTGNVEEELSRQDRDWVPKVVIQFTVPPFAPGGRYRVPVFVKDLLAGTEATEELTFRVRGPELPEADELSLRDFRYLAHEDDRFALTPAVYHPGDTVFGRFDIVGYEMEAGNRFAVNYGLTAYGPEGNTMFTQPVAAEESGEGFYPQRWVPAGFSLNLDGDIVPGNYAIGITVRDQSSGAEQEFRQPFRIQ